MEAFPRTLEYYVDPKGKVHFADWLAGLDASTRARINTRLKKVEGGNLGDHHAEGSGVFALIFDFGPGYRVYFGLTDEKKVVLLLSGGGKTKIFSKPSAFGKNTRRERRARRRPRKKVQVIGIEEPS